MSFPPCPCGQSWAIVDAHPAETRVLVEQMVAELGEYVTVQVGDRAWRVARRCIAYHGITAAQLALGISGFEEIAVVRAATDAEQRAALEAALACRCRTCGHRAEDHGALGMCRHCGEACWS